MFFSLAKKLKTKPPEEIDRERKEQGFSLYLNGANSDQQKLKKNKVKPVVKPACEDRPSKTAGGMIFKHPNTIGMLK